MTPAIAAIVSGLGGLGYATEALLSDYSFADVLSPAGETRRVAFAAFTQTPPSYRTAAFGVVETGSGGPDLTGLRALGAPMIFAVAGERVELWQVHASKPASRTAVVAIDALGDLFARHAEHWSPRAIHRAKAIDAEPLAGRQFDFVDIDLMIAIEGEVHVGHLILNGTVVGPVHVAELLELQPKARIEGNVQYAALEMHQGAVVMGTLAHSVPGDVKLLPNLKLASNQD